MELRSAPLFESSRTALLAALAAAVLAACGGGGGDGGGGGTGGTGLASNTVSTGVMTKGSTIVNGVRFEDTTQNISIDDTPKSAAALQNGMVVKVVGRVNDDGITGTADRIKALVEVRGNPSSVSANPQSLVLNGQTVVVDDQTVFSNLNGFNAISTATQVEVHGLRDAAGNIRATRIEDNAAQMGDSSRDEIRGAVSAAGGTNPTTFSIGGQQINVVAGAQILPAGASYQNGSVVEVYCTRPCSSGTVFQASLIKVEDAQDLAFQPAPGQRMEAEGLISGFNPNSPNFSVGSTPVTIGSTRFEGGIATDLGNNVKVEAEGSWNGTRLVATKIEFKRSVVRLQGNVIATGPGPNQFRMSVAGNSVTIEVDSLTSPPGVPPVNLTTCVQVRGQRKTPATPIVVMAGEIRINNCSGGGDRHLMQGPVEAETSTTIRLLGFDINISNPTDTPTKWQDLNGQAFPSLAAFLNAVTPAGTNAAGVSVPGTLVKVTFTDGATTVKQVELED